MKRGKTLSDASVRILQLYARRTDSQRCVKKPSQSGERNAVALCRAVGSCSYENKTELNRYIESRREYRWL